MTSRSDGIYTLPRTQLRTRRRRYHIRIPPKHTIDGKQFSGHIDQTMLLGGTEEWTIYNDNATGAAHPFHIHINPFQVVEILGSDGEPSSGQAA